MAEKYVSYHVLGARYQSGGGKATSLQFANPTSSSKGYWFKLNDAGTGTLISGKAKTSQELKSEWSNLKGGLNSKTQDKRYLNCMNLVADMRYAANCE